MLSRDADWREGGIDIGCDRPCGCKSFDDIAFKPTKTFSLSVRAVLIGRVPWKFE